MMRQNLPYAIIDCRKSLKGQPEAATRRTDNTMAKRKRANSGKQSTIQETNNLVQLLG